MLRPWLRFLFFRADRAEMAGLDWRQHLAPALVATWVVGMGRYWDHPSAGYLQMFGLGSVAYVFLLGTFLFLVIAPLRPLRWTWLQTITFVALTSPPAVLYAIPVERFMSLRSAAGTNVWFLAIVAAWRVALLVFILRRHAGLTRIETAVGTLLPLAVILIALASLNLEHAVFEIMAGLRETPPTANDGAFAIVVLFSMLAMLAVVPLLLAYGGLVWRARSEARRNPQGFRS